MPSTRHLGPGDHARHLRQAQQHLLGDRLRRRLRDPRPRRASRHRPGRRTGRRRASGRGVRRPRPRRAPVGGGGRLARWTVPGGVRSPRRSGRATRWRRGLPRQELSVSLQKERSAASSWCSIRAALSPSSRPMLGCGEAGEVGQQEHPALLVGQVVQGVQHGLLLGAQPLLATPQPGDVPSLRHRPRARTHPLLGVGQAGDLAPVVAGGLERVADRAAGRGQVAGERVGLQDQPSAARQVELVEVGPGPRDCEDPVGRGGIGGHDRPRLPACLTGSSPSWDRMGRR